MSKSKNEFDETRIQAVLAKLADQSDQAAIREAIKYIRELETTINVLSHRVNRQDNTQTPPTKEEFDKRVDRWKRQPEYR